MAACDTGWAPEAPELDTGFAVVWRRRAVLGCHRSPEHRGPTRRVEKLGSSRGMAIWALVGSSRDGSSGAAGTGSWHCALRTHRDTSMIERGAKFRPLIFRGCRAFRCSRQRRGSGQPCSSPCCTRSPRSGMLCTDGRAGGRPHRVGHSERAEHPGRGVGRIGRMSPCN